MDEDLETTQHEQPCFEKRVDLEGLRARLMAHEELHSQAKLATAGSRETGHEGVSWHEIGSDSDEAGEMDEDLETTRQHDANEADLEGLRARLMACDFGDRNSGELADLRQANCQNELVRTSPTVESYLLQEDDCKNESDVEPDDKEYSWYLQDEPHSEPACEETIEEEEGEEEEEGARSLDVLLPFQGDPLDDVRAGKMNALHTTSCNNRALCLGIILARLQPVVIAVHLTGAAAIRGQQPWVRHLKRLAQVRLLQFQNRRSELPLRLIG
jgi:hypothetical protein